MSWATARSELPTRVERNTTHILNMSWATARSELPTRVERNTTHELDGLRGHSTIRTAHTRREEHYAHPEYVMGHSTIRTAHTRREEHYPHPEYVMGHSTIRTAHTRREEHYARTGRIERPQHDQNCPHASRGTLRTNWTD